LEASEAIPFPGVGFNVFKALRRHFPATPVCRLGKKFVEPQPLFRRLAAQRSATRRASSPAGAGASGWRDFFDSFGMGLPGSQKR
jgi:hypothetical protein